ncbi:MAG TPA: GNAT family N-acetyltransferase [Bryobacteraceae bacterium]|nr:GNAT family N-acetyltransferase [Bryobacteraceae bacterium]
MTVQLRPPLDHEWPICRMLLPENCAEAPSRQYLLCLNDRPPHAIAAASYRQTPGAVADLRLHVIPPFRRRGVGSEMVAHLTRGGALSVSGVVDLSCEDAAVAFCEARGFARIDTLTTVEAEIAGMREYTRRLCGRRPAVAEIVPLSCAPAGEVARLHARYVAHQTEADPWRHLMSSSSGVQDSPVALIGGTVVGALLWELEGQTAVVRSRVAAPGKHMAWVNALLLAEGLDGAWRRGAARVRFTYNSTNRDTRKLARRFGAQIAKVMALFTLRSAVGS